MAKNKSARNGGKLSGAVLIMVVTVMFVLIIMLLATLTVVSTAQNRYYTKYEENQAYYTARSALDVFTQKMLNDSDHEAYNDSGTVRTYKYTDEDGNDSSAVNMTQGLALELEMYKIKAQNDAGLASNFEKTDNIFDPSHASTKASDNIYCTDLDCDEIKYDITFPSVSDGTDDYGRFVDEDQDATITVEILERHYNFGGENAAVFEAMSDADLKTLSNGSIIVGGVSYSKNDLKEAIRLGERTKDKMRLKITATVYFMDTEGTAVLLYDTDEADPVLASKAIISLGTATSGDSFIPVGGTSTLDGDLSTTNSSLFVGDMYVSNNLTMVAGAKVYYFSDTVHTVLGNMTFENGHNASYYESGGSVLYVGGTVTVGGTAVTFGSPSHKTNLIVNEFTGSDANWFGGSLYGNMYVNTLNITNGVYTNADANIYANVICDSNAEPIDSDSDGINDTLNFSYTNLSRVNIAKAKVYDKNGTEYTIAGIGILTDSLGNSYNTNLTGYSTNAYEVKMSYSDPSYYSLTSEYKKTFTMPVALAGTTSETTVEIPTARTVYKEIFEETAFVDQTPDQGQNGSIDTTVTEYPTPTVTPDYTQTSITVYYSEYWYETITASAVAQANSSNSAYIDALINGMDDATKILYYGEGAQYWSSDYNNDKNWATTIYNNAVAAAKASDPTYQAALQNYWSTYIDGAEKAGITDETLYIYSNEINVETNDGSTSIPDEVWSLAGTNKYINTSGYIRPNNNYGTVIIDATAGDIDIQLGCTTDTASTLTFFGTFIVYGSNEVRFFLPCSTSDEKVYNLGNTGYQFQLWTYDLYKEWKSGTHTLELGTEARTGKTLTASPAIHMYAANTVTKINMYNNCFASAHIYAPFSTFYAENHGMTFTTYYNGESADNEGGNVGEYVVVGSIICGEYECSSAKPCVAYIGDSSTNYQYGDPQFNWDAYQYMRN